LSRLTVGPSLELEPNQRELVMRVERTTNSAIEVEH
jgi:hypothetical protein